MKMARRGFSSRKNRSALRHQLPAAVELLEVRSLLTVGPLPLTIDADSYDSSSILVRFREDVVDLNVGSTAYAGSDGVLISNSRYDYNLVPGMYEIYLDASVSVEEALAAFRDDPNVLYAEPNFDINLTVMPNDSDIDALWGMNNTGQTGGTTDADIDVFEAWDITTGTGSTIVAIIDTGVDYTHPDLAANIWVNPGEIPGDGIDNDSNGYIDDIHGYDFSNNDADPMDDNNHGTHVAGTIGGVGNNGIGVAGVNWNATIMPVKFLSATGGGRTSDAIEALEYAVANGARISNNSWGFNGAFSQPLYDAIANARDAGHIFVAAAGNGDSFGNGLNNDVTPFWPSNSDLDNVVAVAALDHNNDMATFSNYGAMTVDVGAPGVAILSTTIGNSYSTFSGTSMATPHVSGLLSLILDQNPTWGYQQAIDRLYETTVPISSLAGKTSTGGSINAALALGPDITGPRAVTTSPSDYLFDPFSKITVTFSETIDAASFTAADIVSLSGPNGAITVDSVVPVAGSFERQFNVTFSEQDVLGAYTLVLGPNLTDLTGNLMDQDRDGTAGENTQDRFSTTFSMVPFFLNLDFGTDTSPVQSGNFVPMLSSTVYTASQGYGWSSGSIDSRDRGASLGNDLERDLNFMSVGELKIDVPAEAAVYQVKVTMGDGLSARDAMGVSLEGLLFDAIDTAVNQYVVGTYLITVGDGQLNIKLEDLGGADATLVINGIEINAIGPDLSGPKVVATTPDSEAEGSINRIAVTFDEAVDAASFTVADVVSLTGPNGAITATEVTQTGPNVFDVTFATQTVLGDYSLTIGPEITDVAGNLMNQDGDATGGEATDDRFTKTIELVPIPPFEAHFDFGTSISPTAAGTTQALHTTSYSSALGYGWTSGSIDSRDRGSAYGTDITRDFNFTQVGTFAVDVPAATAVYDVTVTLGDGLSARDDMGVIIEGIQVDSVDSPTGQYVTKTYRVTVADGQITLILDDLSGATAELMINALDIVAVGLDTIGAKVVSTDPDTEISGGFDHIEVTFDEAIDAATFTTADVIGLSGPTGAITPTSVVQTTPNVFEVRFAAQTTQGDYTLTIGPDIADLAGNLMNQDGDAVNGEATADQFSKTISLVPVPLFEQHFDFGTISSPVLGGTTRVAHNTTYSAALGYGWSSGSINSRDRGSSYGNALQSDFNFTALGTFVVDVPGTAALYDVTVTMGDGLSLRDEMGVTIEGVFVDSVTSPSGQYVTNTYRTTVADGQLTLLLDDLGGSNTIVMINGLDVVEVGPDLVGPQVTLTDPAEESVGAIDHIQFTFNEGIDASTFTTADIVSLTGPGGAITPTGMNQIAGNVFEVTFAEQTTVGDYTLTLGPKIKDVAGNLMNQDGDAVNGEATEDQFSVTVAITPPAAFELHYDFGTTSSVVADGATRVAHSMKYSSASGFGWTTGFIYSRDRGANYGNETERDFNFTGLGTFVTDVPAGTAQYDVTVIMGDGLGRRDFMGVFLEGTLFGTLTSEKGQYVTATYRVTVSDGQLTVLFDDLGGSAVVMINGMDIVQVQGGASGQMLAPPVQDQIPRTHRREASSSQSQITPSLDAAASPLQPVSISRSTTTDDSRFDDNHEQRPVLNLQSTPRFVSATDFSFDDELDAPFELIEDLDADEIDRAFDFDHGESGEDLLDALMRV